jgi:hypothetical protein
MSVTVASGKLPFEPDGEHFLSIKQMAEKRGVSDRTIRRDLREFDVPVHDFTGNQPIFTKEAYEFMEKARVKARAKFGNWTLADRECRDGGDDIISMKQMRAVKREARRNGKASR